MSVKKFLADYSQNHREPFNEALFVRSEYDIIEDVKKVIMSVASDTENNGQRPVSYTHLTLPTILLV